MTRKAKNKHRVKIGKDYQKYPWWINFCKSARPHLIEKYSLTTNLKLSLDQIYNNLLRPYNARIIMFGERQTVEFDSKADYTFFVLKWS
jgi:hypothetical protein